MMNLGAISQLEWQTPWGLLLVLQPLLMRLLLQLRRQRVLRYAEPHLLPWAVRGGLAGREEKWRGFLNLLLWLLLAVAAGGPRVPSYSAVIAQAQSSVRPDVDLMIVLNISSSMMEHDIQPQRLQRAKLELHDLTRRLHGERIGLIVYAGSAGLMLPPSSDYEAFHFYLNLAQPGLIEASGAACGAALQLAAQTLQHEKSRSKAVLLLTDGEAAELNGEPGAQSLQGAQALRDAGIPLFILGMGATDGTDAARRMDASRLAELARLAQGKYAAVSDGDNDWRTLYDNGAAALPSGYRPPVAAQNWRLLYPWFLFPALLLIVLQQLSLWRTPPGVAALIICSTALLLGAPPRAHAAQSYEQSAYAAYRARDYTGAQIHYAQVPGFAGRMGEGASAYRRKDYIYAARQFTAALLAAESAQQRADALFNLGNSEYMANRFSAAADAYLGVLRYRPGDRNARINLDMTGSRLAANRKLDQYSEGILGRKGNQVGGALNEDIGDRPVAMEQPKGKDRPMSREEDEAALKVARGETGASGKAGNRSGQQAAPGYGSDLAFKAAAKKLELVSDKPDALLSALIQYEAQHEPGKSP